LTQIHTSSFGFVQNTLNTTPKKSSRLDKMTTFSALIIVMVLVFDFLVTL
jgi:hypothetical protein